MDNIKAYIPITRSQMAMFLEDINNPGSFAYSNLYGIKVEDGIDINRLKAAVEKFFDSHEIFHVTFGYHDGIPSMIVPKKYDPFTIEITKADNLEDKARDYRMLFDLNNGPLFKAEMCEIKDKTYILINIHHIINDGTSVKNMFDEIGKIYDGIEVLPEEKTLLEYAGEESVAEISKAYEQDIQFYDRTLGGADMDSKPVPDVICDNTVERTNRLVKALDAKTADEIARFSDEIGVRESSVYMAAFAYTLAKFNNSGEASFVTANHGRKDKALLRSQGMFVNAFPLHFAIDEDAVTKDFVIDTQEYFRESIAHTSVTFNELYEKYDARMEVSFIYQGGILGNVVTKDGIISTIFFNIVDNSSDFQMMIMKKSQHTYVDIFYNSALYSEGFANNFVHMYELVLAGLIKEKCLKDIVLTDENSIGRINEINDTESAYDTETSVVELFKRKVQKHPDNNCVVYQNHKYSYKEVDELTDNLAGFLIDKGVMREKVVGVLVPRNEYMPICALSVLKAGGAYLPLDPTYPSERINLMIEDSGAMFLILDEQFANSVANIDKLPHLFSKDILSLEKNTKTLTFPKMTDLFIMLYTSGSTGVPKGVMYEHSNALVTATWVSKFYNMDSDSAIASYASFGFDANVFETYPALISGAQLHIIPDDIRLDLIAVREYFNANKITHVVMTTQVGRQVAAMSGFETLKCLSVAGEKLAPVDVQPTFDFYNLYGPTEGSVVTSYFKVDKYYKDIPIGKPVDNLKIYVIDKQGRLLPTGTVGELCISGPHVTRGYLNRPEAMEKAYTSNPFCKEPLYDRLYHTGDIVRILEDGNLQFVGRKDGQVKIRGYRIELSEVEEVLRRYPGVSDATVAAFDDFTGGKFIAAYVVGNVTLSEDDIADYISKEKPPYMVPKVIMQIDAIPLNQNHKVNKKALPVPKIEAKKIEPPTNDTQKKIFDIIARVIGNEAFGINTPFEDAGLTSIGNVRLNVELAEEFKVALKISDIKTNNTIVKLEQFLAGMGQQAVYDKQDDYPLSENQNGIWVEEIASPGTTKYNIPLMFEIDSQIDTQKLKDAIVAGVNAHPYIKTKFFVSSDGSIRARRLDDDEVFVEVIRSDEVPSGTELVVPFELLDSNLYRFKIIETKDAKYLFMDLHHMISDGTSEAIILSDISAAYIGREPAVEQYGGYEAALEEEKLRKTDKYDKAKEYWAGVLSCFEEMSIPKKSPESPNKGKVGQSNATISDVKKIAEYCKKCGCTQNAFFNAAFSYTLGRYCNSENVAYATVHNGRSDSRLKDSVAMLVKTMPVVATIKKDITTKEYISAIGEQLSDGMAYDLYSFAELSNTYGVSADIIFVYQGADFEFDSLCGKDAKMKVFEPGDVKANLTVNVYLKDDKYVITADYSHELYSDDMIKYLLDSLKECAGKLLSAERIAEISILSENSRNVYENMNSKTIDVLKDKFAFDYFDDIAAKSPDKAAIITSEKSITYSELKKDSDKLSDYLVSIGVKAKDIIGVILNRTPYVFIAEIGAMKAGGAFLPILPSYPDDRIEYCLNDSEAPVVITEREVLKEKESLLSKLNAKVICVEDVLEGDVSQHSVKHSMSDYAYCIYTSGSTGTPKGVLINQYNFVDFLVTHVPEFECYKDSCKQEVTTAISSISFDFSILEVYLSLFAGRTVYFASEDEIHNPQKFAEVLKNYDIAMFSATPSFMMSLLSMPQVAECFENITSIFCGAEAFSEALFNALRGAAPKAQILNGYGPTECAINSSFKVVTSGENITIGGPFANSKLYVVDKDGNILPPYASGELIICGPCVGDGYIKLPEKTAAAFFTLEGLKAYHSGDQVRLTSLGELEFAGRMDNQVKLRGFRIELDEIENVMLQYEAVSSSKVVVKNNGSEDYLAGYFTAEKEIDIELLVTFMKSKLASYMVPGKIMQLDKMPLTPNGKIDKKALPEIKDSAVKVTKPKKAPKKSLEQKICDMFAQVLNLSEVYADDDFFELGGTSLSASKVTMLLMSENIKAEYGDIFDNPTPESLAAFIENNQSKTKSNVDEEKIIEDLGEYSDVLSHNVVKLANTVKRESLGDVILTGAVGFLGIHVLHELLENETGRIYCLIRKGEYDSPQIRLKTMWIYYFGCGFTKEQEERITILEADITDKDLAQSFKGIKFSTLINCAACVKHFTNDDILTRINVYGVDNLIEVCKKFGARLIQISTTSVPGVHTDETYEKQVKMHENELFVIDDMDNKYVISKYTAETHIFSAIRTGLKAKVIRVGNLMGRDSDGEFQVNMETNMFMSGIRGFATMGKYPISHMTDPMRFSPVDCTAKAIVLLAGTNDEFTAFNADNRYGFDEMKIIDACNRNGITILPEEDAIYYAEYNKALGDDSINSRLNGLAAYDRSDLHSVETDNLFTTNILYRIGFSWPLVDDEYLTKVIKMLNTIDYFGYEDL